MEFANAEIEDLKKNDKENEVKIKELEEKYRLCFKKSLVGDHYVNFLNDRDHFLGQKFDILSHSYIIVLRTKFHRFQVLFELNIISSSLFASVLLVRLELYNVITLIGSVWVFFLIFPIDNHLS